MSDDSDLLFAAAATAALVTWLGTRGDTPPAKRRQDWRATLATARSLLRQGWRETPGYVFVKAVWHLLKRD